MKIESKPFFSDQPIYYGFCDPNPTLPLHYMCVMKIKIFCGIQNEENVSQIKKSEKSKHALVIVNQELFYLSSIDLLHRNISLQFVCVCVCL